MAPEQLAETWRRHSARLLLIARAIGEPAEDAVQEAFLQLARQSTVPAEPLAWLVTVTRNQLLQWKRRSDRRRQREQKTQQPCWFVDDQPQLEFAMDAGQITNSLRELEAQQRQVIVMHLWGDMSFEQIAEIVGCSRSSAHRTYQTGIRSMRKRFNPLCDTASEGVER